MDKGGKYFGALIMSYLIYDKWVRGVEMSEKDVRDFYVARIRVKYYEGSRISRQQRSASAILENRASRDVD
ncbi:hypothetical protein J4218_02525 [Candidatus Pacearchaeota archaeon]|nr:hypothetical protein [Candidatus Pacearchaeota archaeon]